MIMETKIIENRCTGYIIYNTSSPKTVLSVSFNHFPPACLSVSCTYCVYYIDYHSPSINHFLLSLDLLFSLYHESREEWFGLDCPKLNNKDINI